MSGPALPEIDAASFVLAVKHMRRGPSVPIRVVGSVDLANWRAPTAISFERIDFDDDVSFENAVLPAIGFSECTFNGDLSLANARVRADVQIEKCSFPSPPGADPRKQVRSRLTMKNVHVGGDTFLQVDGAISLVNAVLQGDLRIVGFDAGQGLIPHHIEADNLSARGSVALAVKKSRAEELNSAPGTPLSVRRWISFAGARCARFSAANVTVREDQSVDNWPIGLVLTDLKCLEAELRGGRYSIIDARAIVATKDVTIGDNSDLAFAQSTRDRLVRVDDYVCVDGVRALQLVVGAEMGGKLRARACEVTDLILNGSTVFAADLTGAQVRNMISCRRCTLSEGLTLHTVNVRLQIQISGGEIGGAVNLQGSDIGSLWIGGETDAPLSVGGVWIRDSTFRSYLRFCAMRAEQVLANSIRIQNCSIDSDVDFWVPRIMGAEGAVFDGWQAGRRTHLAHSLMITDCDITGDLDLTRLSVDQSGSAGAIVLDRTKVGGRLYASSPKSVEYRAGAEDQLRAAAHAAGERLAKDQTLIAGYRACAGSLSLVECDVGGTDLSGLALFQTDGCTGTIDATRINVRGAMSLYTCDPAAPDKPSAEASIPGALRLGGATVGELRVTAASFADGADARPESDGIVLETARLGVLRVPAPSRTEGPRKGNSFPVPLDLSGLRVQHWFFSADDRVDAATQADDYLDFLDNDDVLQRDVYASVAQTLRNLGQEDQAQSVLFTDQYRADATRRHGQDWRWREYRGWGRRKPVRGGFGVATGGRRLDGLRDRFFRVVLNYGWNPTPLLSVILALGVLSFALVAIDPANVQPSPQGWRKIAESRAGPARPRPSAAAGLALLDPRGHGPGDALWLTVRHHVPMLGLGLRGDIEPSDAHLRLSVVPDNVAAATDRFTAEDWFGIMTILNWVMWPLLLSFWLRKLLRGA